jgi:hypothetical protein
VIHQPSFPFGAHLASPILSGPFPSPKESAMTGKQGCPSDDVSSAPESGTVRDDTSGNSPSDRGLNPAQKDSTDFDNRHEKDDPSIAGEER